MRILKIRVLFIGLFLISLTTFGEVRMDHISKGKSYLTELEIESAINAFSMAIEEKQNVVEAYLQRAKAYLISGECEKAAEDYSTAFELDPQYVKKQLNITEKMDRGDFEGLNNAYLD